MKFTIDIDCTPQEARAFIGLPNVEKYQDEMMKIIEARMADYFKAVDPETMAKMWLPTGLEAWENMQKAFMASFLGGDAPETGKKK